MKKGSKKKSERKINIPSDIWYELLKYLEYEKLSKEYMNFIHWNFLMFYIKGYSFCVPNAISKYITLQIEKIDLYETKRKHIHMKSYITCYNCPNNIELNIYVFKDKLKIIQRYNGTFDDIRTFNCEFNDLKPKYNFNNLYLHDFHLNDDILSIIFDRDASDLREIMDEHGTFKKMYMKFDFHVNINNLYERMYKLFINRKYDDIEFLKTSLTNKNTNILELVKIRNETGKHQKDNFYKEWDSTNEINFTAKTSKDDYDIDDVLDCNF